MITKPCPNCHGEGTIEQPRKLTVKIPAGIATGQRLRLTGEGEAGALGGPPGDLYVVIAVQEHAFFQRDGNDLLCTVSRLHDPDAGRRDQSAARQRRTGDAQGARGHENRIAVPVRGKGIPDVSGRGRGDLLVTVQAITPRKLTKEQRKLLEQLAATLPRRISSRTARRGRARPVRQGQRHLWLTARIWPRAALVLRGHAPNEPPEDGVAARSLDDASPIAIEDLPAFRCRPAASGIRRSRRRPIRPPLHCTGGSSSTTR